MKKILYFCFIFYTVINTYCNSVFAQTQMPKFSSEYIGIYNADNMELLYGKNEEEKISIASITKLMTAVVSIENIEDLNEKITIDYNSIRGLVDPELAISGIYNNQVLTYYDLLATMLIPSGADSAMYLTINTFGNYDTFIYKMNEKAKEIGMNNTNFSNSTGLDDDNNYSTISDVAKLFKYVLQNSTLKEIISMDTYTTSDNELTVKSTIQKSATRNGVNIDYINGGKTGTTGNAGQCLVSYSQKDEVPLIAVVTGASMYALKPYNIIDSENLYEYISNNYSIQPIISIGDMLVEIKTICCKEDSVQFFAKEEITKYIDKFNQAKLKIIYEGMQEIDYTVKEGTVIGKIDVYYEDKYLESVNIELYKKLEFSLKKWIILNKEGIIYVLIGLIAFIIVCAIIGKNKKKSKVKKAVKKQPLR